MRKGMRIITILSLLVIAVMAMAACGGGGARCHRSTSGGY